MEEINFSLWVRKGMFSEESDRDQLARLVQQWNENRLDLFHLSYPTEELEIEGVMRFYFQVFFPLKV